MESKVNYGQEFGPNLIKIAKKVNKKAFITVSVILFTLFILDIIIWGIIH